MFSRGLMNRYSGGMSPNSGCGLKGLKTTWPLSQAILRTRNNEVALPPPQPRKLGFECFLSWFCSFYSYQHSAVSFQLKADMGGLMLENTLCLISRDPAVGADVAAFVDEPHAQHPNTQNNSGNGRYDERAASGSPRRTSGRTGSTRTAPSRGNYRCHIRIADLQPASATADNGCGCVARLAR